MGAEGSTDQGLGNLRKRLEYLYPGNFTFETGVEENVFFVKLIVPLQNEAEIAGHRG